MTDLSVTLMQTELAWQNPQANREWFTARIERLGESDLVILPEMFTTGFTMDAEPYAETMDGVTLTWMADLASRTNKTLTGSLIVSENKRFYNRLIWMRPDGSYSTYDKRHLFRMAGEQDIYTAGNENVLLEINGWKVLPQICYDLRFPVWSRNVQGYDLLLFVANWPAARRHAWSTLLRARAIENLAYVAAVNRIGKDGNGYEHSGDSAVIDYKGQDLITGSATELIQTMTLNSEDLKAFRGKFQAQMDADQFEIKI